MQHTFNEGFHFADFTAEDLGALNGLPDDERVRVAHSLGATAGKEAAFAAHPPVDTLICRADDPNGLLAEEPDRDILIDAATMGFQEAISAGNGGEN